MEYEPHDYQAYATKFIEEHPSCMLALDMGLGKTVITLTALNNLLFDSFDIHKVLVITPLRIGKITWPDEWKKWPHLKELKISIAIGTEAKRLEALKQEADIYIINRENVGWICERLRIGPIKHNFFDTIVIDESSSFKNPRSMRFKELRKILKANKVFGIKRIIELSGTPCPNSLLDLWSQYYLLDQGDRLGEFITHYRDRYFRPGATNGVVVYNYIPLLGAEEAIYKKIEDITISMKAIDHLKMPDLIQNTYKVYLSPSELKKYQDFKKQLALEIKGEVITAANAAVLSNKLLQVANGAIYEEDSTSYVDIHDKKLEALEDIVESANGKPILVAYWFQHDLERIKAKLSTIPDLVYEEINTEESIRRWNNKEIHVGLVQPQSVGHGLNLQKGGNTIIWYSMCFSLEAYQQTNARLYRQGQESDTVVVIHLVTDKTIDEHALRVLEGKTDTQNAMLNAVRAEVGGIK